jgi:hypothetical protein
MKITMIILFLEEKKLQFGKKSVSVIHCITGLEITGRKDAECVCFFIFVSENVRQTLEHVLSEPLVSNPEQNYDG